MRWQAESVVASVTLYSDNESSVLKLWLAKKKMLQHGP